MNLVLGFDYETTGLDPKIDRVIEIGATLWDWDRKNTFKVISELVWEEDYPESSEGAAATHRITQEDLEMFAVPPGPVFKSFVDLMGMSMAVMAHNADFDVSFLREAMIRYNLPGTIPTIIDTKIDLPLDPTVHESRRLMHLAASHGFINPFPHRSLSDTLTMCKVASYYDLNEVLVRAKSPKLTIIAEVSYDNKDLAKQRGYHWEALTKTWEKAIKEIDLPKEAEAPFNIYKKKVMA